MDFTLLAERVEEASTELATVEERFDTSTAMGRVLGQAAKALKAGRVSVATDKAGKVSVATDKRDG